LDRQLSLFNEEESEGNHTKKSIIRPRPMVKKRLVLPIPKAQKKEEMPPKTLEEEEIPFKEEIYQLLSATRNRMLIDSAIVKEYKEMSKYLVRASEKIGGSLGPLINSAVSLLKNKPNLYANQAIEIVLAMKRKPTIIRRRK